MECVLQVMMDLKTRLFNQPTFDKLELKKDKGTDYVLCWKSKGVYNSKLKQLDTDFFHSMKLSEYKIGIKFDKYHLVVEKYNYFRKIFRYLARNLALKKWFV